MVYPPISVELIALKAVLIDFCFVPFEKVTTEFWAATTAANAPLTDIDFGKEPMAKALFSYLLSEICNALKRLDKYQILVTMPNADTMGLLIRNELIRASKRPRPRPVC